jgi:hypothetical protein
MTIGIRKLTFVEYLAYDDGTDTRYELVNGELVSMSLGTGRHGRSIKFIDDVFNAKIQRSHMDWTSQWLTVGMESPRGYRWDTCRIPAVSFFGMDMSIYDREAQRRGVPVAVPDGFLILECYATSEVIKGDMNNPIRPATPDQFLPAIGKLPVLGGLVLLMAFGGAIALARVLKYKVTVKAPATVRPVGELRIVQSAMEGMVKRIAVESNQTVKEGEPIAIIDDLRLRTKKNQLEGSIQQTEHQLRQLTSQLFALNRQIEAEAEQANRTIASGGYGTGKNGPGES